MAVSSDDNADAELAITQALVRAHGGHVSAASAGSGLPTFTVTVPASRQPGR